MSSRWKTAIGLVLSILLLVWTLRDVSVSDVATRIRMADPVLFTLSVLVSLGGFWFRAVRWGIFLAPVAPRLPMLPRLSATFIGFAANNLLPARIGEFARAFSLARATPVTGPAAFAGLVLERIFDGLVLVGLLFLAMSSRDFPDSLGPASEMRTAALMIAGVMTTAALLLLLALLAPRRASTIARGAIGVLPARIAEPVLESLRSFVHGLTALKSPRLFILSFLLALGQWSFLALSFAFGLRAFGIETVPFLGAIFLQSLVSLAVAIPSSPGFFGPFEAASRIGLGLWGVPADQAVSFAIGYHLGGFLPVTIIGLLFAWKSNLRWSNLRPPAEVPASRPEPPVASVPGTSRECR